MSDSPVKRAACARAFKFRIYAEHEAAYATYVREVVDLIDAIAHADDAYLDLITITPDKDDQEEWNLCRTFTFRDEQHRAAFAEKMAKAAAHFDGNDETRDRRKKYAETLRKLCAAHDYRLSRQE